MVFGELNENNGIVDAENKSDVKKRLKKCKLELDDKEIHLLQKNEDYVPKFSQYIEDRQDIISKSMSLKARPKAHMPVDEKGTPLRPYTNSSESMNNVMSQAENDFLRYNNKGKNENLSKLEFGRHVFEEIHEREMRELKLALCGLREGTFFLGGGERAGEFWYFFQKKVLALPHVLIKKLLTPHF